MWSTIDREVSSIKQQVQEHQTNVSTIKDILNGYRESLFSKGPGLLVDVHREAKSLYPIGYTGINLIADKNIGDQVKYSLNLNLDPTQSERYGAFNSYLGRETKKYSDQTSQAGFSTIEFKQDLSNEVKMSLLGHVQHVKNATVEAVLDYFGKNFTSSVAVVNCDAVHTEAIVQHLHSVNEKLAVGAEVGLQTTDGTAIDSKRVALVGRYYNPDLDGILSGTISLQGLQVCLYKKINANLRVGSTMDVSYHDKDITGSVAAELTDKEYTLRTSLDSKGCIVTNLLKNHYHKRGDIVFKPSISLLANVKMQVKLGIGFQLLA